MRLTSFLACLIIGMMGFPDIVYAADNTSKPHAPLFNDLGTFHRKITTNTHLAQRFFDQGLVFFYSFEWGESVRSFKEATRLDPECGMCYWGLSLASGYKGNAPMNGHEYSDAKAAIEKALLLGNNETPAERALIKALALRFQHVPKISKKTGAFSCHANGGENASPAEILSYAMTMKKLTAKFPADNDILAIYSYALFDVVQWKFWDNQGKINAYTPQLIKTLGTILANDNQHVGANHYYVHVLEQSAHPKTANSNSELLKTLVPGSEHLVHMPAHIDFLTGRYHEGTEANENSIAVYKEYTKICRQQGFKPEITFLYQHDFDFLRTTASMEGRSTLALQAARELMANLPTSTIAANSDLQWFIPIPSYVQARFGMWDDILKNPMPDAKYQYAVGMWHYVRGMALAHTEHLKDASTELLKLQQVIRAGTSPASLGKSGLNLLKIANEVLIATLANFHGDEKSTLMHLKTAAQIQFDMGYHEPPDWYFPLKEIQADANLKWGHVKEAMALYNADLKQYPKNGWALYGLAEAFRQAGDNGKADQAESEFKEAWKYADAATPPQMFR
jgi:tetratricopeptide (TPR) repeat protein